MTRMLKQFKSERGQGLVEFALILPIFLLLVLGMLDFGWLLNAEISVNSAAKEAARIFVVADGKSVALKGDNVVAITGIPKGDLSLPLALPASGTAVTVEVTKRVTPLVGFWVKGEQKLVGKATMRME